MKKKIQTSWGEADIEVGVALIYVVNTEKNSVPEDVLHLAHDIYHIADYQVAGPWRIPYLVALPVESLKLFDPNFSLSLIRFIRQIWVQRLLTCDYLQDSRGIEKGRLPEGIELSLEGNGAAIPSLLATPGLWSSSHCHCSWLCFTVSCLNQCHRLSLVP